jgi:hypothetical protein
MGATGLVAPALAGFAVAGFGAIAAFLLFFSGRTPAFTGGCLGMAAGEGCFAAATGWLFTGTALCEAGALFVLAVFATMLLVVFLGAAATGLCVAGLTCAVGTFGAIFGAGEGAAAAGRLGVAFWATAAAAMNPASAQI